MLENEYSSELSCGWNGVPTDPGRVVRGQSDEETPVSVTVIETIAEAEGVTPTEIETPLFDAVDPDALDRIFDRSDDAVAGGQVVFSFGNYEVTVTARGDVCVCPDE